MDKPKFSVISLARNEAKTLPRLLESLKEFLARGGEFILVDTGSTDGTADVARKGGAKVFEVGDRFTTTIDAETARAINHKFVVAPDPPIVKEGERFFSFADARNYAKTLASNDFVCTPDCDEAWTVLNIDAINELINRGYEKLMVNFVFSHFPDGSPSVKFAADTRFYDRRKIWWKGIIHETQQHEGEAKMATVAEDVAYLEHYQNQETDRTRYLSGLGWACYQEPKNDRNSHYFARELMYRSHYASAIKEFRRHIDMNAWDLELGQSMVYLGNCHAALGQDEWALEQWHKAIGVGSPRREGFLALSAYWQRQNKPQLTAAYAMAALEIPNNGFYANDISHYTTTPYEMLYWAKGWLGDIPAARKYLLKCLDYQPTNEKFLDDMKYYFSTDEMASAKRKAGLSDVVPVVSVLMPAYNAEKFIGKAIESCQAQTLSDWELIIVDDGSTDRTQEVVKRYSMGDKRIKTFAHQKNESYPQAFNTALGKATGKYIARLDADDWDDPTRLEKCVSRLRATPICDCVSCNTFWGEEGNMGLISTEKEGMVPEKYMDFNCYGNGGAPVNATIVAKREIYDTIGGFGTWTNWGMDSEWDVRSNLAGTRWAYINEPLYYYRRHEGQTVAQKPFVWYRDQQKDFLDKAEPFWTNPFNPYRHIEVLVTGKCNKNCQFCSQATFNKDHLDYQASMAEIEKLCKRSLEIGARYEWLQFSGGEPMLWDNLEDACKLAKDSGAFKKVRVFTNGYDRERIMDVLDKGLVDSIYTNSSNADPKTCRILRENYGDRTIIAPLEHKPLPVKPLDAVLPAMCNCNHLTVIGNNVYPCGNFYEHTTRLGFSPNGCLCTLDDDWISFFRRTDRFNMDICSYCLANGRVWEQIPYPSEETACV